MRPNTVTDPVTVVIVNTYTLSTVITMSRTGWTDYLFEKKIPCIRGTEDEDWSFLTWSASFN